MRGWMLVIAVAWSAGALASGSGPGSVDATALAPPSPRWVTQDVTLNVLNPVGSVIASAVTGQSALALSVEYERVFAPRWTWEVSPGVVVATLLGRPLWAPMLAGGVRYFFAERAPQGWWIQPEVAVAMLRGLGPPEWQGTLSAYGGYTFVTRNGFTASLGAGVSFRVGALGSGVLPALRTNLGYAF